MASSKREESPPSRHSDINVTDRDTVTKIADITFNNFKQYFDSKIGSLKRELKEDATNKSERVVKQLKSEHSYKFKFNGNQVQHEFNSDIDYEVSRIKRAAEREDYSKVRDICSDIRDKFHKRNKCIKIADKSPAGWDTVKEYMSDDLASDSEDEKKIRSAEPRAIRDSFEYEKSFQSASVKGRLKEHFNYWQDIDTNTFVLDIIKNGYSIPFITSPPVMFNENNKSAYNNAEFVSEAITDLLRNNCIVQVKSRPHVVNPLTVSVQSSGKKRLILDLRLVNEHVWKSKIKFEDWRVALQYFDRNNYTFKFDLRSGYHHLDIEQSCHTYLGFSWKQNFYVFTVLPFGLSSSPYIFTKCLRLLVKHWRKCGIRIVLYLDGGWGTNSTFDSCNADSNFVLKSLTEVGFVINTEKSVWKPCQELIWLGIIWNSKTHTIHIPDKTSFRSHS
ncbi:Hypothetical predicted protein [Mytilus galloprovincialis]|uniref:Reverse transcriptase domain-containing protein n=1 Tax=Mytilus galloprovincialis TaxID=29158 RepID=A0A8B6EXS4_MYTGA|nr:Hypothetical predicted protein [Mytilus galloprovincialis]